MSEEFLFFYEKERADRAELRDSLSQRQQPRLANESRRRRRPTSSLNRCKVRRTYDAPAAAQHQPAANGRKEKQGASVRQPKLMLAGATPSFFIVLSGRSPSKSRARAKVFTRSGSR
ncbi:unnamed protein product [Trichogramma brassicae]|uniref:Uncharacterized protein n=1 Tax=Trichogramma brassicae TaxID=86971 RepID=A0A6H5IQE3_9HYME|nr:unnamed protein product [Trichogramma brassicae]